MELSLAPVELGTPEPPMQWSNKQQKHLPLDPKKRFMDRLCDRTSNWQTGEYTQSMFLRDSTVGDNAEVYHKNMLEYFEACWKDHLGVVVTPDMFWYTLLAELTTIVKANPEPYRYLFSESDEKRTLIVVTEDPIRMPVSKMVDLLKNFVPTDVGLFIPEFTTATPRSVQAMNIAFCDMCSPYYNYGMLCCGLPAINVLGTTEDYVLMKNKWDELSKLFPDHQAWFSRVSNTFQDILDNFSNSEFWLKMFHLERCGSGSDVELEGWITHFFREVPRIRYIKNYTSGVSVMEYKNFTTNKNYKMQGGLFHSRMEGNFLVPQFGFVIHEVLDPVTTKDLAVLDSK